jgi:hypothetical protein
MRIPGAPRLIGDNHDIEGDFCSCSLLHLSGHPLLCSQITTLVIHIELEIRAENNSTPFLFKQKRKRQNPGLAWFNNK